jgi:MEMO1 family protein
MNYVREPAVSGTFYPANRAELLKHVELFLKNVPAAEPVGKVLGIISPHAGYIYSGQVAAYGYKAIAGGTYDTVVVIAPSHRAYFEGVAVLKEGGYRTPLGVVPVDEEMTAAILGVHRLIGVSADAHRGEHSLEVQLPFLQATLASFKIVPLLMGIQDQETCRVLAETVSAAGRKLKRDLLIVGSTDLSHYHTHSRAATLDKGILNRLEAFDSTGLLEDVEKGKAEACGAGPMATTMLLASKAGATRSKVLRYADSGDVSGDKDAVVGYVSCIMYKDQG